MGLSEEWSTERDVIDGSSDDTAETDLYLWTIPTNEFLFFLSGHEQPIKIIYGFFIRHSGQLS